MRYLVHHLLRRSAERHPDRVAVRHRGEELTYAALDAASNAVAWRLRELGVGRGDRVALYLEKSIPAVVGIYAALKAGAAYVPFDPLAPPRRLSYMTRDCGPRVVLVGSDSAGRLSEVVEGSAVESIVTLDGSAPPAPSGTVIVPADVRTARADAGPPETTLDNDLAYILYTSGSTGDPKGVMVTHRNALAFVEWAAETFELTSDDRLSSHAPFHFDLSVFDLFAAAAAGAAVVLVPPEASVFPVELRRLIDEEAITVWYSVPSILTMLAVRGGLKRGDLPRLRTVLFAGEVFPTKYLRQLMELVPHSRLANLYGPTETNVCTWYEVAAVPEDVSQPIPIGHPIANVEVFAMTEDGTPASRGTVGELYVRGATVTPGYWGDPERTAHARVQNPLGDGRDDPVYRTGDLVRQGGDGEWHLLGRRDHQIKSRGYRIELGEIEAALYEHPAVEECAVIAVPDEKITNRIQAHVALKDPVEEADLVRFVAERLPRYMVPERVDIRDALPRMSTGKIDRQNLARGSTLTRSRS